MQTLGDARAERAVAETLLSEQRVGKECVNGVIEAQERVRQPKQRFMNVENVGSKPKHEGPPGKARSLSYL